MITYKKDIINIYSISQIEGKEGKTHLIEKRMEFNKVNFEVIRECFEGCESKEAIFSIFQASACYVLDAELKVLKPDTLPPSLRTLP